MPKTRRCTINAVNKYNEKFDRIVFNAPKGTKERIKALTGTSCNAYVSKLVTAELDRLEKELR